MKRSFRFVLAFSLAAIFLFLALLPASRLFVLTSAADDPQQAVQRAWELAKQAGSYRFAAQVEQLSIPLPIPSNVGKESRQQSARLEGTTNLAERKMEFTLNAEGGSPLDAQSGTQIKVDGDKAYSRQGQQAWQEIDDFTSSIAPQSDFMAFLAGAENIRLASPPGDEGIVRYTFDVDGPGFAAYLESQLSQQLVSQGKLPPGVTLDLKQQFASLSGTGEIWIGADGLPVRQVMHVQLPPTSQEQIQADIEVTFRDFSPLPAAAAVGLSPLERLQNALQSQILQDALLAGGFLTLLGFALLVGLRRKPVYIAIIVVLIAAMVIGPLLQSVKAAEFTREQSAQAQAQEQRQQAAELAQSISAAQTARINPNISPLETALAKQDSVDLSVAPSLRSLPFSPAAPQAAVTSTSSTDSDLDGLTDDQEALLGTDPTVVDTDGDTIGDYAEVTGFKTADGKTWYGDPLSQDTNEDGVGDKREWSEDTNHDNNPDMWSFDNDGDAVPDKSDLSPFALGPQTYDGDHPLEESFNDLTPNALTYVEFQVRPTNSAHLRYAFSVLDWPTGDIQGQMMDADGKTFKDVDPDSDSPQDVYGDVKLVPMLEIEINGEPTNLPDEATLEGYGVTIRDLNSEGSQKAAYVPLQVVKDAGENWVAFYAKMAYLPAATWGNSQLVRMIWAVQALVDVCAEEGFEENNCEEFETYNETEVIQTYYDSFTLTGLNVSEQHGSRWAVAYKDPAAITDADKAARINQLDPLSDLVFGLDHSFLAGRLGASGERDFPVTDLHRRFDHTVNASVPVDPDRFGIDDNILLVKDFEFAHIDLAYQQISMTETQKILDSYTPYWTASQPITPTILFAHEEYYRPLNLDSMASYSNISISSDGYQYTLSLPSSVASGSSLAPVEVVTATALNWAPYIYQGGKWAGAPLDDYLEDLGVIYPPETIDSNQAVGEGGLMFLEEYYANIYQGCFNIVEEGEEKLPSPFEETDESIEEYLESWEMVYEPIKIGLECFFEIAAPYHIVDAMGELKVFFSNIYFRITGNGSLVNYKSSFEYEHQSWGSKAGLLAEGIAGIAWLITHIPPIHEKLDESVWGKLFIVSISASFVGFSAHKAIAATGKHAHPFSEANGAKSTEFGFVRMIVVTSLLILANVGAFIYMAATNGLSGVQLSLAAANMIASIVVIVIFAIISAIPVFGPLIVTIYNLVNTILSEFLGANLTEMLIEALVDILYDVDPMVSLSPTTGESLYGFVSDRGISVGNGVNISFPMDVKATQEDPQSASQTSYIYNDYNYDLLGTRASIDVDGNESAIEENSQWHDKQLDHYYTGEDVSGSHVNWSMYSVHGDLEGRLDTIHFTQAGLNQHFTYESEFDYTIHVYTCSLEIFCSDETASGSVEDEPPALIFDVFPADVDGFYAWNWAGGSLSFPVLQDRDNDGLVAKKYNGNDPDDTKWDSDGDTLSDKWEMDMAATPADEGGFAFNPNLADTDSDGLRDDVEARWGSDPAQMDTDGDGRLDRDEVNGYNFYYASPLFTLVRSSPLTVDTDGDNIDDKTEFLLHQMDPLQNPYNPNARNTVPLSLNMQTGVSGYMLPGGTSTLNITLKNTIGTPIKGDVTTELPAGITASKPTTAVPFEVQGQHTTTLTNQITVAASPPSSQLPINSTACSELEAPLVYLPFDDPSGSKTFYNQASPGRYNATCINELACPTSVTGHSGQAVNFNDPNARLVLNDSWQDLDFSQTNFSLSVWIYIQDTPGFGNQYILSKTDTTSLTHGYNLYVYRNPKNDGSYFIGFNNEYKDFHFKPIDPLYSKGWNSIIVLSYIDGSAKLILNGESQNAEQVASTTGASQSPVALGSVLTQDPAYPAYNFVGSIDELYLFDRTLSTQEWESLSQSQAAPERPQWPGSSVSTCEMTATQAFTVTVDTDSPTASLTSLTEGNLINGSDFQVIGGEAHDPTSFVSSVQVSVDGGAYRPASGAESWAYTWDKRGLASGMHYLDVRAIDAVGHVGPSSRRIIKLDNRAPTVGLTSTAWPVALRPTDIQTWVQHFNGSISDDHSVDKLEILVNGGPNLPYGGWQAATIDPAKYAWSIDYKFPISVVDLNPIPNPTGTYTLRMRATDIVGNTITFTDSAPIVFDNTPPTASLASLSPSTVITTPLTISGEVADTGGAGISSLGVAVIPVEQAEVVQDAALVMHFDEGPTSNGQSFMDASGFNQTGYSDGAHTPLVNQAGKVDQAIKFDGVDDYIQWKEPMKTPFTNSFTAALWFKTSKAPVADTTLFDFKDAAALLWMGSLGLCFRIHDSHGDHIVSSGMSLADGQWHHVVGSWNGAEMSIYIDGALKGSQTLYDVGPLNSSSSLLTVGYWHGVYYDGLIDEMMFFQRAFTAQEASNLYQRGNMVWNQANLAQPGARASSWSYSLPAGLDGLYEIDLRGADTVGNRNDKPASWRAWQGEIDTRAPQLLLQKSVIITTTQVKCYATDFNLTLNNYECTCGKSPSGTTTYDQVNDWYREVTGDTTRLYRTSHFCSFISNVPPVKMTACDKYGHCATAYYPQSAQADSPEAIRAPEALEPPGAATTLEASDTPEITDTPEAHATPEVFVTPEATDTPAASSTPEDPTATEAPGLQADAAMPEVLPVQDVIATTDVTATLEIQTTPEATAVMEVSATPEATATMEVSATPEATATPEVPATVEVSATPEAIVTPEVPATSEVSATPEAPVTPEVPATSEDPATPEATAAPEAAAPQLPAPADVSLLPISALVDPADRSVLTSLDPVNLTVHAEAASGLKEITLTLDGGFLTSFTFPDASVTGYAGSTTWTPAPGMADGAHIFQTSASDWAGQVQTEPFTSTIFIDTQPPAVDISPTVLTSTHMVSNWGVELGGPASDLAGVSGVQVALQGGGTWNAASVVGDQWSYPWRPEKLPDGQVFTVDVQATDLGSHTTQVSRPVTMDLLPPSPVPMTLSYLNSEGVLTPVTPGQTIYDVLNPTIQISWTPASDGSGLRRYYAGLSQQDPPDLAGLTQVSPVGTLQVDQAAAEAQAYTAYVVSEDNYGNRSWNRLGPIYTDTPLTPDLIAMPTADIYHGWMDSGESQIGLNRLLPDTLPLGLSLNHAQKFYLSWDADALRLAWLGADWDSEGDLFIYLNTGSGPGTDQAHNPYPATAGDTLTLPFAADTLVWVNDAQTAQFLHWDGAAWREALPGGLPPADFRFTAHHPASMTDLYLPFDLLGIADPATTSLDLIAFGSQQDALRLWTVFPIFNPHDSPILSKLFHLLPDQHNIVMKHAYHWNNLSLGQSPNQSRYLDVDVRALLRADPVGRITNSRLNALDLLSILRPARAIPLVGDGQVISYRLTYVNLGGAAAPDDHLTLQITSTGPLELPGGAPITKPDGTTGYYQALDLGPILPGAHGTVEFTGLVHFGATLAQYHLCLQEHPGDPAACQALHDQIGTARIEADLKTSASEDVVLSSYTAEHLLVVDPPVDVAVLTAEGQPAALQPLTPSVAPAGLAPSAVEQALSQPPIFVRTGVNTIEGTAVDPSGVASVKVQVLDPYGDTMDTTCQVAAPRSGKWSCGVNMPEATDEARYFVHARATNTFGYTSNWGPWRVLVIDSLPPTVSLDLASQSTLNTVIGPVRTLISGEILDNGQVKNVDVCLGQINRPGVTRPTLEARCQPVELSANDVLTGTWSTSLLVPLGVDYASQTLSIYGWDAAGNRSTEPYEQTFWFDTVPPSVTVTTQLSTILLSAYTETPQPILAGTASDGSGKVTIVVRMTSPETGTQRTVIPVEDNRWSYFPEINAPGVYSLSLQALDAAGNLTSLGSWTLQVVKDQYKLWFPLIYH